MAQGTALVCKLLASSVSVAHRAGKIIRDVMHNGDLGIIDKVNIFSDLLMFLNNYFFLNVVFNFFLYYYLYLWLQGENDLQTEADRSAQRCIVASFKNLYPNVHIVAEEVDKISQNLDVPEDWLITDLDPKILELECPKSLLNVTEDQVSV